MTTRYQACVFSTITYVQTGDTAEAAVLGAWNQAFLVGDEASTTQEAGIYLSDPGVQQSRPVSDDGVRGLSIISQDDAPVGFVREI